MAAGQVLGNLKEEVQQHFELIRESINVREKLLLRQIDVIASQTQGNLNAVEDVNFIPENEENLLTYIRSFGKLNLDNLNFATDLYANEDYISPVVDHETMYKCLQAKGTEETDNNYNEEEVVVDFSSNKRLIKENVSNINDHIINITLTEAKELIEKTKPATPLKLEKEVVSQSSQTDPKSKGLKANITINNCNGTINLKNISNLTINCAKQDSLNVEKSTSSEYPGPQEPYGESESKSEVSSTKDNENNSVNCEFYSRLISEIKNSLKQVHYPVTENIPASRKSLGGNYSKTSSDSSSSDSYNRKFLLKNFENLKIVLENNENETHPVQIEQWLAEIVSETEIEPMQNTEILEHSKIHGKELY